MSRSDVETAAARIEPWVRLTPVVRTDVAGHPVVLKLEHLQHTGTFKPRGMFNRLLAAEVLHAEVVIASGGNAGLAAAHAAATLGHRCTVFVPATTPSAKVDRLQAIATEVRLVGQAYADALAASTVHARGSNALVLHAYDQADVVAGQGTVGLELQSQIPGLDTILVAVGGGGLIGGIAAAFAGAARVVAVEPAGCPTLHAALQAGRPVEIDVRGMAVDSLGARVVGEVCWSVRHHIAEAVVVEEDAVREAQRMMWRELRQVVEPGGAVAVAALTSGAYRPAPGERVAVVVCGANTDPSVVSGA